MDERGEQGMGFSQTATTHHFCLKADGGVVQVESISATDATNRDNIRMHTHRASLCERRLRYSHVRPRYGASGSVGDEAAAGENPLLLRGDSNTAVWLKDEENQLVGVFGEICVRFDGLQST
jgi:hypothetical protein